jgi:hypothetical protein
MAREIPEPVRAAAGLAASVLDEVRKLPETLPGLPVRAIGLAMQATMKLQQEYAGLVARGDELFTGLRGDSEPGLATFDDDVEDGIPAAQTRGFRDSAFDRVASPVSTDEVVGDPLTTADVDDDPAADAAVQAATELIGRPDGAEDALEELAIEELVDAEPPAAAPPAGDTVTDDADAVENALLESDAATDVPAGQGTLVDVVDADGDVTTAEAVVTDEGVATPEPAPADDEGGPDVAAATGVRTDVDATDTSETDTAIAAGSAVDAVGGDSSAATDDPAGGSELAGSQAAGVAPVDGYDGFSIAQLRGRLRGYAPSTVENLLAYEEATRARQPYVRMLRNRLERLNADA